jgi:hypothetical protein
MPGGPKGGTPHACHEAKAAQAEKAGNHQLASEEKKKAKTALEHHHAQGNHKRWALALAYPNPDVPKICKEAAAVQEKNNPGAAGKKKAAEFLGNDKKGKPHHRLVDGEESGVEIEE